MDCTVSAAGAEVESFDFGARPRGAAQELQARGDARVFVEAADLDVAAHLLPAEVGDERFEDRFERDAVERVFGMRSILFDFKLLSRDVLSSFQL